jgi:hypothetical protein
MAILIVGDSLVVNIDEASAGDVKYLILEAAGF